jgi:hypothetical protein
VSQTSKTSTLRSTDNGSVFHHHSLSVPQYPLFDISSRFIVWLIPILCNVSFLTAVNGAIIAGGNVWNCLIGIWL